MSAPDVRAAARFLALCFAAASIACAATVSGGPPKPKGCASSADASPALANTFHVGVGGRATVAGEGLTLTFEKLLGDSRCPVNVVCVWEGEAKIRVLAHKPPSEAAALELNTNDRFGAKAKYLGYEVELLGLTPLPEAGRERSSSEYCAELKVVVTAAR